MLPLAEEIREARAEMDEAYKALTLVAPLPMIEFMLRQLLPVTDQREGAELPGEQFVTEACARWGIDVPPVPDRATMAECAEARWQQIQCVVSVIQPIADLYVPRHDAMVSLTHDQFHLLEDPMFEVAVADIARMEAERNEIMMASAPLQTRQTAIRAMIAGIRAMRPSLDTAIDTGTPEVMRGGAVAIRQGIEGLAFGLDVPLEPPQSLDDPATDAARLRDWLAATLAALEGESRVGQARIDANAERWEALTRIMQEHTG
jgi:hypothetical protein